MSFEIDRFKVEEKFNLYFNPAKEKYRWIDSGYLGISYQYKPSTIPSSLDNIFDSATSEIVGKELNNKENKNENFIFLNLVWYLCVFLWFYFSRFFSTFKLY